MHFAAAGPCGGGTGIPPAAGGSRESGIGTRPRGRCMHSKPPFSTVAGTRCQKHRSPSNLQLKAAQNAAVIRGKVHFQHDLAYPKVPFASRIGIGTPSLSTAIVALGTGTATAHGGLAGTGIGTRSASDGLAAAPGRYIPRSVPQRVSDFGTRRHSTAGSPKLRYPIGESPCSRRVCHRLAHVSAGAPAAKGVT